MDYAKRERHMALRRMPLHKETRSVNYVVDLFSGTGELGRAFGEALRETLGVETRALAYCEQDRFCQALLMSRMWRGEIDHAPICTDVRELRSSDIFPRVFALVGGWPCQGNSTAGRRKGMEDERSGLVKEVARLIGELRPDCIYLENVPGVLTAPGDGVGYIADALARFGYEFRHTLLSAAEVGASHNRERFWIYAVKVGVGLANSDESGRGRRTPDAEGIIGYGQDAGREQGIGDAERDSSSQSVGVGQAHPDGIGRTHQQPEVQPAEGRVDAQCDAASAGGKAGVIQDDANRVGWGSSRRTGIESTELDHADQKIQGYREGVAQGDTSGQGQQEPRQSGQREFQAQEGEGLHDRPEQPSLDVADSDGKRRKRSGPARGRRRGPSSEGPRSVGLADTNSPGCEKPRQEIEFRQENSRARPTPGRNGLPFRPPFPNDTEAWAEIIHAYPEVEPAIRVLANGFPFRNDFIRTLGNGVDFIAAKEAAKLLITGGIL